jgi:hypothetical protein
VAQAVLELHVAKLVKAFLAENCSLDLQVCDFWNLPFVGLVKDLV